MIDTYHDYWDRNINRWSELYLDISHGHERLQGPAWLSWCYNVSVGRLERRLMVERYRRTIAFLDEYVRPGISLTDLGCGNGIFVVEALKRGAKVNAVDFSAVALEITRRAVAKHCEGGDVRFIEADAQRDELPFSDATLVMGVTPYISELSAFMDNVLSHTRLLYCLYIDPAHWANRLRKAVPSLNVRRLQFYARSDVDQYYATRSWNLISRTNFATGYIDLAEKKTA
jgi:predicted RNA methylase